MMISQIPQSSILSRRLILVVCCVSALPLSSQFPYEFPRVAIAVHASPMAQQPDRADGERRELAPGYPIDGRLDAGQSLQYQATLAAGEFAQVVVEQRGVAVEVTLIGPHGNQLLHVDSPGERYGPESVSWIAEEAGDYQLLLCARIDSWPPGRYQVLLKEKRQSEPLDHDWIAAERAFAEGVKLGLLETQEGRRRTIEKFQEASKLFHATGNTRWEAYAKTLIAERYYHLGDQEQTIDYYLQSLPLFDAAGDRGGKARALNQLGAARYKRLTVDNAEVEMKKARETLREALPILKEEENAGEEYKALHCLGEIHFEIYEMEQSLDCLNGALDISRRIGSRVDEADTHISLGAVHFTVGDPQEAINHWTQALKLYRAENRPAAGEGEAIYNLGLTYSLLGEKRRALEYNLESLDLRVRTNDLSGAARTRNMIGANYEDLGDREKAIGYYEQAYSYTLNPVNRPYPQLQASALSNLGHLYSTLAPLELEKAIESYTKSLKICKEWDDPGGQATALHGLGYTYAVMGQLEKALDYYRRSTPFRHAAVDRRKEAATRYGMARVLSRLNRLDEAREQIRMALDEVESLRAKVLSQNLRASYFATVQEYFEFQVDLLMRLDKARPGAGYLARAFEASEQARARSLLESLAEARVDIRAGVESELLERESKLRSLINARASRGGSEKEINDLFIQLEEVQARIRAASPRHAGLTQPQPLSLAQIQRQLLDADTALLEYALGEERSYLWVVTRNDLAGFEAPRRDELESAASRVYELLTARARRVENESPAQRQARVAEADKQYYEHAMALSRTLLGPAMSHLGKKRLLIVAAGKLQLIPFAALPIPNGEVQGAGGKESVAIYQPLITAHEIVSLPSASTLDALRREAEGRPAATKTVAIFADPVYSQSTSSADGTRAIATPAALWSAELMRDLIARNLLDARGGFQRLPFSLEEANGISSLAPAARKLVATGFNASRANVMSRPLGRYRNVHFVTHGVLDEEHPELSGLALSLVDERGRPQDGFLRLHDIYNLNLTSTELVVLSACQTGLGKNVKGEGLVGLTRGFMYAGSPRVVASLWIVNDWGTSGLMKRFYKGMLGPRKLRPAAALRDAQEWMWRQGKTPEWQAPYYWAAFTIQGEWK